MHAEVLTPEMRHFAPRLCRVLAGLPFIVAGGTGLALQIGHRVSVDKEFTDILMEVIGQP